MSETVVPMPPRGEAIVKADPAINSGSVRVSAPVGGSGLWEAGGYVYEPYLPGRYQGENGRRLIYMMASRDPTIRAMLLAMKLPIRTVLWHMQPATDDAAGKEAAAFGESLIAGIATAWNDVLSEILTEIEYGWSALELVLCRREDGRIGIGDLQPRAQDTLYRWDFDDAGNVTAMHQQLMSESVAIPAERLVLFRTECHKNSPEGRSMLLSAADSYRALRHITQIESIAIERDFTGIPVAYIPAAALADAKLKQAYTQIVRDLKMNDQAGLVLPSDPWRDTYQSFDVDQAEGVRLEQLGRLRLLERISGELDPAFRQAITNADRARFDTPDIERAAASVPGVSWVRAFVTGRCSDVQGMPSRSVAVAVIGGDDGAIAAAIRPYVVPGIDLYGNTRVDLVVDGRCRTFYLVRPVTMPLGLQLTVRLRPDANGCPPPSTVAIAETLAAGFTGAARPENGADITLHLLRTMLAGPYPNVEILSGTATLLPATTPVSLPVSLPVMIPFLSMATVQSSDITIAAA